MSFIGRRHELEVLEKAWRGQRSAFVPIYGRRRVGKSELIVRFGAGKPGIYFVGKRAPAEVQIQEFMEAAAHGLQEPVLAEAHPKGWRSAFELVLSSSKAHERIILALDEFQWIVAVSPELPSVIQELWDRRWSRHGNVFLIICGSNVGFMERQVLGRGSPLFGRRTAHILLRPFSHIAARAFHPRMGTEDHARIYAICGGIPAYLLAFDQHLSVEQNITATLLEETGVLSREPELLLREELRDLIPYHAVLMSLAQGIARAVDLAHATGIDSRALSYHLGTLMELGYIQRRYPLTEKPPTARSVRYVLDDPLLRFWFRFIFPRLSILRPLGATAGFTELVRPELDAYLGYCFERLCREALPLIYLAEGVRAAFSVGEYWDRHVQIDLVGLRQDGWTDIGECRWSTTESVAALAVQLERKVHLYPNQRGATIRRRLFLRAAGSRARNLPQGVRIHSLADLYNLPDGTDTSSPLPERGLASARSSARHRN